MKIKKFTSLIFTVCFLLSSCNTQENENNINEIISTFTTEVKDFTYETNNVQLFDVSDDGTLCYLWQDLEKSTNMLTTKDLNGNVINNIDMENLEFISSVSFNNNILYYTPDKADNNIVIYYLNTDNGENKEICVIENFKNVKYLTVINDNIYFIGCDKSLSDKFYELHDYSDNYMYEGEVIKSYDIKNKKFSDIDIDLPVSFVETADGNLKIYAYDKDGGYYFQDYNIETKSLGVKTYNNSLKMINCFTIDETGKSVFYNSNNILKTLSLSESDSTVELVKNVKPTINYNVIYKSGFLFYNTDKGIKRTVLNEVLRSSTTLNLASIDMDEFPDNCGYRIKNIEYDNVEDFVLSVLSGDSSNDMYLLYSRYDFTDNMRVKGAFYPLTDVPGVKDYLDATFPYVKEAATDKNGEVWMLPIDVYALTVQYNERVWERNNLDTNVLMSLEDMANTLFYIDNEKLDETYDLSGYVMAEKYFYQLIRKNNGFEQNDFKQMAEFFYNNANYIKKYDTYSNVLLFNKTTKTDFDSIIVGLFSSYIGKPTSASTVKYYEDFDYYEGVDDDFREFKVNQVNYRSLRHVAYLKIAGMEENDATCVYICVNPNSKNLNLVIDYISALSKYKINQKNSYILEDKSTYDLDRIYISDHYNIYSENNYIRFGLSGEIFYDDFIKYLGDEITLDEYLNRIEYKINAYMNE